LKISTMIAAGLCAAAGIVPWARAGTPIRVVALSTVLTEIASRVGGPAAAVTGLLPAGVDPHSFEPAPVDLKRVAAADLVLASGLGLENYLGRLVANSGTRARVVEAGSVLGDRVPYLKEFGLQEPDPHWWNSIEAVERVTRLVRSEFSALRPEEAAGFSARAQAYLAALESLDGWSRSLLAGVPPAHRHLVTTHDAFGWFARDYGFTVHPISGISPDAEPNARQLAQLARLIRADGIPAIFAETSTNPGLVEALVRETGARLGGALYADGLSPDGDGTTYEGMFRHNVRTIVEALR
jgi:zinc/manganese transport system substrate-binding protein